MDKAVHQHLFYLSVRKRMGVEPSRLTVRPKELCSDGRKRPKVLRSLVTLGYIDQTHVVTDRLWDETEAVEPDLRAAWAERQKTRRNELDLVRFDSFGPGERKWLAEHGSFYWVGEYVSRYESKPGPGDLVGPFPLAEAVARHAEAAKNSGRTLPEFDLYVTTDGLREFVERTRTESRLRYAVTHNLGWGLHKLGLLAEDEAERVRAAGGGNPFSHDYGCLGEDPAKWGDALQSQIANLTASIDRKRTLLATLTKLAAGVESRGGWERVASEYAELVRQALNEKE